MNKLYTSNEYINNNPSLHEQDSPWKIQKIIPFVDRLMKSISKKSINILDVGGGAGLILFSISEYIEKKYHIKVEKFALDLSEGMLQILKKRNPDLKKGLNEDICNTSIKDKEMDLTLMIDLIEHIPNPEDALKEVRRISSFIIFKVPLENNLILNSWNIIYKGRPKKQAAQKIGHISFYNFSKIKNQIKDHAGELLYYNFTNVFDYVLTSKSYKNKMQFKSKVVYLIASYTFKLSPRLCAFIFSDFIMILVKCYKNE